MAKLDVKSRYDEILEFLGKEKYFESDSDLYFVENGIIFHLRKKDIDGDGKSSMVSSVLKYGAAHHHW